VCVCVCVCVCVKTHMHLSTLHFIEHAAAHGIAAPSHHRALQSGEDP